MLRLTTGRPVTHCDRVPRRELLRAGAIGFGGLTLPGLLRLQAAGVNPKRRIDSVILLYLSGGPSQLDMWDMKPHAPEEIRGTFQEVPTNVPGIRISEHMPRMATLGDQYTIVRSMSHNEGDHIRGGYWVMTGGRLTRPIVQASGMKREDRPHIGSALDYLMGASGSLPSFAVVPEFTSPVGVPRPGQYAGFLGPGYDPYLIDSDPNLAGYDPGPLRATESLRGIRLSGRQSLLQQIDGRLRVAESASVDSVDAYKQRAFDMISSPRAQRAFDIAAEPTRTRDRYGRHVFGQSALVARRLVEAGVRLVQVNFMRHDNGKGGQGYDSHSVPPSPPHLEWAKKELLPPTDAAFAALVEDLAERDMLERTLVVLMGEFGRTPRFNKNGGRDHWPQCYSLVLAGGGVGGGRTYGASDKLAAYPTSDPLSPDDLLATVYSLLGVDPHSEIEDPQGRPHRLTEGQPRWALLG